jgi:Na+/proline symporter
LYWKRASTQGAVLSIVLGFGTWLAFLLNSAWAEQFPGQLAGLIAAGVGMVIGSFAPQVIANAHDPVKFAPVR